MQSPANVLLVDDDDDLRPIICELIETYGHRPLAAADLRGARELMASEPVDAVLLDWNLEGETAADLLDELAERDDAPPTILFSASVAAKAIAEIYELPLVGKPFDIDHLDETLRRALDKSG